MPGRRGTAAGREHLAVLTRLLQDVRLAHPTAGVWEAADLQWWWRRPRSTDGLEQPFWADDRGCVVAATVLTDWGDRSGLDVVLHPGLDRTDRDEVWAEVWPWAAAHAPDGVDMVLADDDGETIARVTARGLRPTGERDLSCWLDAAAAPPIVPLAGGDRLEDRRQSGHGPHPMVSRNGDAVERRLRETSLYRPDLDLCVRDGNGEVAAYGLFWFDPVTRVGLVEPMRTEDAHQGRGLGRHVLSEGVRRLVALGAERVKVTYLPDNPAAGHLYRSAGFRPTTPGTAYRGAIAATG